MSEKDENQIRYRLKVLSQIEPSPNASQRAVQNVRNTLANQKIKTGREIIRLFFNRFTAAAVLFIGVGLIAGRLFVPAQNMEELQAALKASLEPVIMQNILTQINEQWQETYASNYVQMKDELGRQMSRDLTEFAEQTLAASSTITDQRLKELIQLIEAARVKDRQWIAAALEQIELSRRQDNARIGGLVTLATRTNEMRRIEQN